MKQQTSLDAYASIKDQLAPKQAAVLEFIEEHQPVSNLQIASGLRWPINTVTPRVLELRKKGKVEASSIGVDPGTGRRAIYWKIAAEQAQLAV